MILLRYFKSRKEGFYIDVGAHHPKRFSNTYFFYKRGWRGINIEPNPKGYALLKSKRKRDINVQCGISDIEGTLDYYMFDEPALNTFDQRLAQQHSASSLPLEIRKIQVIRLETILDDLISTDISIDFMNIDVEGHDLNVLRSNNWEKYRAHIIIVEALGNNIEQVLESEIANYMKSCEYDPYAKTVNSVFYKDSRID